MPKCNQSKFDLRRRRLHRAKDKRSFDHLDGTQGAHGDTLLADDFRSVHANHMFFLDARHLQYGCPLMTSQQVYLVPENITQEAITFALTN